MPPETRYAKSGDVHVAYQVFGDGPVDLVMVSGLWSHLDLQWEHPPAARVFEKFGSFARCVFFDRRGVGLSDPVTDAPTLEERMDDVRAVMDAANLEKAFLFGHSEGAPMCLLFAATYPERVQGLVLYAAMARTTEDVDYPFAPPKEALLEASRELIAPHWGEGTTIELAGPTVADDPEVRSFYARLERQAVSPGMIWSVIQMFLDIDVRDVLPAVRVPTLVLHRRGDRIVNVRAGRWLADHIDGARFVELPGASHNYWYDGADLVLGEVEEFVTGTRHSVDVDRVLTTVLFTDIVGSTQRAAEHGDRAWRDVLDQHGAAVRRRLSEFRGREVKTTGDGFLATFDGPARGIRCALAIQRDAHDAGLGVRAGLHTGECEVVGDDIAGISVHIAARVGDLAQPGEVLVTRTVKDLVAGSGITFDARGEHTLKGVPDPWNLYSVEP